MSIKTLFILVVCLLGVSPVLGQEDNRGDGTDPAVTPESVTEDSEETADRPTDAETQLMEFLEKTTQTLERQKRFQLVFDNQVALNGDRDIPGLHYRLTMRAEQGEKDQRIQWTLESVKRNEYRFQVDWDGNQLTRVLLPEKVYSTQASSDWRQDLRQCPFTSDLLTMAHGDFLFQPNLLEHVRHQLVYVSDLGDDDGLRHFQLELTDGREMDLWFQEQTEVVFPLRMKSRLVEHVTETEKVEVTTEGEFQWSWNPDKLDWQSLPEKSLLTRVSDLQDAMLGNDSLSRIGQPLPEKKLFDLEGNVAKVGAENRPMLLYFWATWAAPSVREMEGIETFANRLQEAGVEVHPVNVGQAKQEILEFLEGRPGSFTHWKDVDGSMSRQLGLAHLPSVVIVDGNGNVAQVFENVGPDDRPRILESVTSLQK